MFTFIMVVGFLGWVAHLLWRWVFPKKVEPITRYANPVRQAVLEEYSRKYCNGRCR